MGKNHCTVSSLTKTDLAKEENMLLFVSNKVAKSVVVKLETSCTMILSSIVLLQRTIFCNWTIPGPIFLYCCLFKYNFNTVDGK